VDLDTIKNIEIKCVESKFLTGNSKEYIFCDNTYYILSLCSVTKVEKNGTNVSRSRDVDNKVEETTSAENLINSTNKMRTQSSSKTVTKYKKA
jgi:hypothetical protein